MTRAILPSEDQIQASIVDWLRRCIDCVVFHIPNGGARSKATGAMLKRQGVLAGAPDLCVITADETGPITLFIEVKTKTGHLSESQREFRDRCLGYGIHYLVARDLDDVRAWFTGDEVNA